MGKNHQNFFFDFRHQNGSIREKKAKKYFELFEPKKFYHPRWGDLQNHQKIFFCIFGIRMTQFAKKKHKKIFDPNLVLECVECGPKRGQNDLLSRRIIYRLNCLTMSYLNMNFQPKVLGRFEKMQKNLIFGHKRAQKKLAIFVGQSGSVTFFLI